MKKICSLLVSFLLLISLVACGSTKSNTSADSSSIEVSTEVTEETATVEESSEPVTIRCSWWGGDTRHEAMLAAIGLYEEQHPNVTIEGEYQGYDGYYEKMITTISNDTAPDLMLFKKEWLADVQGAKHYLADLTTLPVDVSTLAEGLLENSGTYKGEALLYSTMITGQVIYVNTEFASEFGIDINKTYTWDELMELGNTVHEQDPDAYLMTADVDVLNKIILLAYLGQTTGTCIVDEDTYELNFNQEQLCEALQLILDLYDTGTLEPFGESSIFVGQMDQNTKWVNGKIGMLLDVTGSLSKYRASVTSTLDVMAIPRNADAKCSGVDFAGNTGFCINDSSSVKEEAAKFLDFMMNDPEASLIIKDSYGYNSTTTAIDALEEAGEIDPTLKKAIDLAMPNSMAVNSISINTELETIRKDILQEVIYGDITPEDAAEEIVAQYQEVLSDME